MINFTSLFWFELAKNERQSGKTDPARARKFFNKIAGEGLKGPPLMGKGRRPHVYEGRARARARARAKYPEVSKLAFFIR